MKLKPRGKNVNTVEFPDGSQVLFSYETPVAGFAPGIGYVRTSAYHSRTTSKHVTQYLDGRDARVRSQDFFDNWCERIGQ